MEFLQKQENLNTNHQKLQTKEFNMRQKTEKKTKSL